MKREALSDSDSDLLRRRLIQMCRKSFAIFFVQSKGSTFIPVYTQIKKETQWENNRFKFQILDWDHNTIEYLSSHTKTIVWRLEFYVFYRIP